MLGKNIGELIQQSQVSPSFLGAQGLSASLSPTAGWLLACAASSHASWCTTILQSIIPVLQHGIFAWLAFFKKTWSKYVFKPLAVRWMHFLLLWMVPCTCSIFPCESSHLFPCLLAFWPLSDAAFLLPSLCFPSATPALAALPTRGSTCLAWLPGAAWHPSPGLA